MLLLALFFLLFRSTSLSSYLSQMDLVIHPKIIQMEVLTPEWPTCQPPKFYREGEK